jgi:VWFA-related protein
MRLVPLAISLLSVMGRSMGAQEPAYRFERRVDVVTVDIAVTDDGRPVDGLTEADFEIRDNGVLQEIDRVQIETAPVDAILVLDNSRSVAGQKLEELRAAVGDFIAGLRDEDRVALVTFSGSVRLWQSLTTDRSVLLHTLDGIVARGLTALKDGLYGGLSLAEPPAERPIVVLFSDGLDNASRIGEPELLEVVRESNAVIYVVCSSQSSSGSKASSQPQGSTYRGGSNFLPKEEQRFFWHGRFSVRTRRDRDRFLKRVADDSGGRFFEIDDASSMESEFRQVVEDIRSRYLLTYYAKGVAAQGWHELDVKLRHRKAELRARQGYYVESPRQ